MSILAYFLIGKSFTLLTGLYYRKSLPFPYILVLYLVAIALFCEWCGYYIAIHMGQQNIWLFNSYMPVEFLLMGAAGILLLPDKRTKKLFIFLLSVFLVIWGIEIILYTIFTFATRAMLAGCIVLTALFITVLFNNCLFNNKPILQQPVFWLALSSILFYACDIPSMGLHMYLAKNAPAVAEEMAFINTLLDIIRYPLVAISFILLGRQKNTKVKPVQDAFS